LGTGIRVDTGLGLPELNIWSTGTYSLVSLGNDLGIRVGRLVPLEFIHFNVKTPKTGKKIFEVTNGMRIGHDLSKK
jgi:hypothetical protein